MESNSIQDEVWLEFEKLYQKNKNELHLLQEKLIKLENSKLEVELEICETADRVSFFSRLMESRRKEL